MRDSDRRALYVSHTGMTEPLGQSQVLPYLRGLARAGWRIDIVGFEPAATMEDSVRHLARSLASDGIGYRWTRRSPSHALVTKLVESARAFTSLVTSSLRTAPRIIHARSYLPAAVARAAASVTPGARFVFDCRGLLGDEYVDFGHWSRTSLKYRIVKRAERQLFGSADAVVVLTDRLRRWLRDEQRIVGPATPIEVIPCCVDLDLFDFDPAARGRRRAELGAGERIVVAYSGTLGAWYCEAEMAELFAAVRRRTPALFAVFTRASTDRLRAALRSRGVSDEDVTIRQASHGDMPEWLSAADVAISLAEPRFSKIASSPVKTAEYLAVGLPVIVNRGVGDQDELLTRHPSSFIDAGPMTPEALAQTAARICEIGRMETPASRRPHRAIAAEHFALDRIGLTRYRDLYERLAC